MVIDIFLVYLKLVHERSIMEMRLPGMQMETILLGMSTIQLFVMDLVSDNLQFLFIRLFNCLRAICLDFVVELIKCILQIGYLVHQPLLGVFMILLLNKLLVGQCQGLMVSYLSSSSLTAPKENCFLCV